MPPVDNVVTDTTGTDYDDHRLTIGIRGMSRCRHAYRVDWFRASAPEFGEVPGKGSA